MRYELERWKKHGRGLGEGSRIIQTAVELCAFDEGFLLGYELGQQNPTAVPNTPVRMTLTFGIPKENQ